MAAGGSWLDPSFGATAAEDPGGPIRALPRQRKVLRFVLEGLSNKEIAWRLQISESYVKAILAEFVSKDRRADARATGTSGLRAVRRPALIAQRYGI